MHSNDPRTTAVQAPSVPITVDPRREKRLHVAVPVKIFLDPNSTTCQLCCTYEISLVGARLVAVSGVTQVGQQVWLQRHNKRAGYRVIWVGRPDTDHANQIGVEALDPTNLIWENELKMRIIQSK
jgi:hypothetical protein